MNDHVKETEIESMQELSNQEYPNPKSISIGSPVYANAGVNKLNLELLQQNVDHCLQIVDDEVLKGYVTELNRMAIVPLQQEESAHLNQMNFFKISELVYQEHEFSTDKLSMIFQGMAARPCSLVLMLHSDGPRTDFYLGVRPNDAGSSGTLFKNLRNMLMGFFPGSKISDYTIDELLEDQKLFFDKQSVTSMTSVTCSADYKRSRETLDNREFIQGLEKFVYAMQGQSYTAYFIANSLSHEELSTIRQSYEQIYSQLSPFANMQIHFAVSDNSNVSDSEGTGKAQSFTHAVQSGTANTDSENSAHTTGTNQSDNIVDTEGTANTKSESESNGNTVTKTTGGSMNVSRTEGHSAGVGIGGRAANVSFGRNSSTTVGACAFHSVSNSVSKTLTHGISDTISKSHAVGHMKGISESDSISKGISQTQSQSISDATGESTSVSTMRTLSNGIGHTQGITLNAKNMTLENLMQNLQKQLERMDECESTGLWNFAAYFIGDTSETETAARIYKSVVSGEKTGLERSAINSWNDADSLSQLMPYIRNFLHPRFLYHEFGYDGGEEVMVTPSSMISSNELAIQIGLPRHSVLGLPVVEHADFAQEVIREGKQESQNILHLGQIYHLGQIVDESDVKLDLESMAMHTFVTGSTGSGKSNAVYQLINELRKKDVSVLVVEPAKGEYKTVFPEIPCYGTNPKQGRLLKINPFSFPEGVHVLEHIDRLVEIFNVCWPMYAAMPAVLKDSIVRAYQSAGWNLEMSENVIAPGLYPNFEDVLRELSQTIEESAYSDDTKGDYVGSLSTRLRSLTNGINSLIFVNDEMEMADLFDRNAIIDISRVGASDTKALIMGLVVMKLQEYRMSVADGMNQPLHHVTVLEEAHNLLKKTSTEQSQDSANLAGKSVEMLTNAIAEIRTYGEGFVIVDQAPNLLDTAVIRNTNTKIVLRLPESADREITGGAMALNDEQYDEISKLPTGVAAVYQNDWEEPVLCKIKKYMPIHYTKTQIHNMQKNQNEDTLSRKERNNKLLHLLLRDDRTPEETEEVKREILKTDLPVETRKNLYSHVESGNRIFHEALRKFLVKCFPYSGLYGGLHNGLSSINEAYQIVEGNVSPSFDGFSHDEMIMIMQAILENEKIKTPDSQWVDKLLQFNHDMRKTQK